MKKILIVLLIISILGQMTSFAANYTDVPEDANYKMAVEVLGALNIFTAQNELEFRPSESMTRGEYITAIVNLLGIGAKSGTINEDTFSDVVEDSVYAEAVYTAVGMGLVSGYSDNTFKPDNAIGYGEAIKILVSALGYKVYAESQGGYPVGYLAEASRLDLADGIQSKNTDELKRSDAALLLYNALETDVMKLVNIGSSTKYAVTKGENVLTEFLRCGVEDDIVKQTHDTTLTEAGGNLPKDEVVIGDTRYKIGKTNATSFLGYRVKAYYKQENEGDENVLLYVTPYKTDSVNIDSDNIDRYIDHTLSYWKDKDSDQDVTNLEVSNKADVIYNGKAYPEYSNEELLVKDGLLTLIDNDEDGQYDVVIITEYEDYVVSSVSMNDEMIYAKYPDSAGNAKLDLSDIEDEDLKIVDSEGAPVMLSAIKANDVLTVKKSKDGLLVEAIVCSEQLAGEITEVMDDSEAEIDYLPHKIIPSFQSTFKSLQVGYKGTFFIDSRGKIAGVNSAQSDVLQYGYLTRVVQESGVAQTIIARIYTSKGTMEDFTVADKLTIDGDNKKDQDFYNLFTKVDTDTNARYTDLQVIKYKLSEDNKLKYVDSARRGIHEDADSTMKEAVSYSKVKWSASAVSFGSSIIPKKQTIWFRVPEVAEGTPPEYSNTFDAKAFTTQITLQDSQLYDFYAYDIDDGGVPAVILMTALYSDDDPIGGLDGDKPADDSTEVMVDRITTAIDEDGEQVPKLYFMEKGKMMGYPAKNMNVLKKKQYQVDESGNMKYDQNTNEPLTDDTKPALTLKQGDIIRYKLNADNVIVGIAIALDIERTDKNRFLMKSGDEAGKAFGKVYSQKDGAIRISTTPLDDAGTSFDYVTLKNLAAYPMNGVPVMIYDRQKGKLLKGSVGDIVDSKTAPGNESLVFIHTKWYQMREVFIIK